MSFSMDIRDGFVDAIGRTPLIRLRQASELTGCDILAKAEFLNPGGSVKDRAALFIIEDAEARGQLEPGGVVVEGTAGNTGIGLALVGNARGYRSVIVIPETQSDEKKQMLRLCGAELVEVPAVPYADPNNYVKVSERLAKELNEKEAHGAVWANQFDNVANRRAHVETTGPEIWEQTGGALTHFVTGLGTSGTFVGTGRFLRERDPAIRLISFEPESPFHGLEGMKHMESAIVPAIYDPTVADENRACSTERAYRQVLELAREAGLLVGISSGANVAMALEVAAELEHGVVVTILCDGADKYLSASFWEEQP
jgi:cysteine synthase A